MLEQPAFWETIPGLIASVAAAVAGVGYLARQTWKASKFGRRVIVATSRLVDIGDAEVWPNGSESLPEAIGAMDKRLRDTQETIGQMQEQMRGTRARLDDYIVTHRQDHELGG